MIKGYNCIVTGAHGGIGMATVRRIAENGGNIWACARREDSEFERELIRIAEINQVAIKPVYFDLCDEKQVKHVMKDTFKEVNKIDALVNAAGIVYNGAFTMTTMNKMKEVFDVNLFGQINIMQIVSRFMMRHNKGVIVNVASVSGIEITEGKLAYGSSKAALIYATKAISKELARYNIRVNAIAPGLTDTNMNSFISENDLKKVLDRSSLKRMAQPEEIADSIVYLISDMSSFMTGQVLIVDGGRMWS